MKSLKLTDPYRELRLDAILEDAWPWELWGKFVPMTVETAGDLLHSKMKDMAW